MANTEIMATLAKVRSAKVAVNQARTTAGLSPTLSTVLDEIFITLDDVENKLILQEIRAWIGQITSDGNKLKILASQIQSAITSLNQVATLVQDAATAIGALASALAAAFSAGLIH